MTFEQGPAKADFEETLQHAELLLDRIDRTQARLHAMRAITRGTQTVLALSAALVLLSSSGALREVLIGVAGIVAVVIVGVVAWQPISAAERQHRRDELIMVDLADMLREQLSALADEEKWSYSQVQLTRGRLSRFPIAAKSPRRRSRLLP